MCGSPPVIIVYVGGDTKVSGHAVYLGESKEGGGKGKGRGRVGEEKGGEREGAKNGERERERERVGERK